MATLVSGIIAQSYNDLGTIATTSETISASMLADAFLLFNQMMGSWANEPLMSRIVSSQFQPIAGTHTYSLGPGGAFDTGAFTATPFAAGPSWRSRLGNFTNGGKVLSFQEFETLAKDPFGSTSQIAQAVAADYGRGLPSPNATPLMTIRIFPTPAASPGILDIDLMFPLAQLYPFTATTDSLAGFSPGWERAMHFNLAIELAAAYPRPGGVPEALAANARNSKLAIMTLNAQILGLPAPQ